MNSFYSGAYTSDGFKSYKLKSVSPDCFRYILKGESPTVKEKLFKNIIAMLDKDNADYTISRNYDNRITGVHCSKKGFIICDGTYPFCEEASTFGAVDGIISTEIFQNSKALRRCADDILEMNAQVLCNERRCVRFLSAAAGLAEDKKRLEKDIIDTIKIGRYAAKLWHNYGCSPSGKVGVEKQVFLSVPTKDGVKCSDADLSQLCDTAIVINDPIGTSADIIADRIRRYALSSGVDIISCCSFLNPGDDPEHVINPSLRFGVFKFSKELKLNIPNIKKVKASRFASKELVENIRVRLQFNQRAYDSLMKEVTETIKNIDNMRQRIDVIYSQATDEYAFNNSVISRVFS